jgi:hypothetical protein
VEQTGIHLYIHHFMQSKNEEGIDTQVRQYFWRKYGGGIEVAGGAYA